MKKIVLVLAVVVLAVAGVFMALRSDKSADDGTANTVSQTPQPTPSEPQTTTITYDENGFSPDMVTIAKGTTVKFMNKWTEMPMWVASDPHPQHSSYPEMDTSVEFQSEVPPANESYSFTFDKAGTWGYHNHSAPEHTATVVVQ